MNMPPDIVVGQPLDEEDKRLKTFFADLEVKQVETLDAAGKSLIERIVGLLAVLFAVTAFGDKFPPPYLRGNLGTKTLVVVGLAFYMSALFMGMRAIQPRFYKLYKHNLTRMRKELNKMISDKARWLFWGGLCFWLGSLSLSALIILIICGF
jgi:hypothetical protein